MNKSGFQRRIVGLRRQISREDLPSILDKVTMELVNIHPYNGLFDLARILLMNCVYLTHQGESMHNPIRDYLFAAILMAPFVALGIFVHHEAPHAPAPAHLLAQQDMQAVRQLRVVVGQVEQAQWLRLESHPASGSTAEAAPPVYVISL